MINAQFAFRKYFTAILTDIAVAEKDICPGKPDPSFRDSVVTDEEDYPWHLHHPVYQTNGLITLFDRELAPTVEIKGAKLGIYRLSNTLIEETESPLYRSYMNREKRPVEY
jgi:hypothetical protein